jgi:hypothetical protein
MFLEVINECIASERLLTLWVGNTAIERIKPDEISVRDGMAAGSGEFDENGRRPGSKKPAENRWEAILPS